MNMTDTVERRLCKCEDGTGAELTLQAVPVLSPGKKKKKKSRFSLNKHSSDLVLSHRLELTEPRPFQSYYADAGQNPACGHVLGRPLTLPAVLHGEMLGLFKCPVHHRTLEQSMDGIHLGTRSSHECSKGLPPTARPPSPREMSSPKHRWGNGPTWLKRCSRQP